MSGTGFARDTYRINEPVDLRLPLILLALGLLLVLDALVVILLSGGVGRIQARLGGLRGRAAMVGSCSSLWCNTGGQSSS